jgi:hypothetical protein
MPITRFLLLWIRETVFLEGGIGFPGFLDRYRRL